MVPNKIKCASEIAVCAKSTGNMFLRKHLLYAHYLAATSSGRRRLKDKRQTVLSSVTRSCTSEQRAAWKEAGDKSTLRRAGTSTAEILEAVVVTVTERSQRLFAKDS
eukprot:1733901-Pleurochrysis_carterae.AAC.1